MNIDRHSTDLPTEDTCACRMLKLFLNYFAIPGICVSGYIVEINITFQISFFIFNRINIHNVQILLILR